MSETPDKKWYVVRVANGKEEKAKEYIEKEMEIRHLESYVSQVLIPTEKYFKLQGGKRVAAERKFFPGYVLIEANLEGDIPHIISNVPLVAGFLSEKQGNNAFDRKPIPMRDEEVARILGRVDELADKDAETITPFTVGEAVKITDGPFNGFDGTIEEILEDKKRIKVMVKIFGRKNLMELEFAQVSKE